MSFYLFIRISESMKSESWIPIVSHRWDYAKEAIELINNLPTPSSLASLNKQKQWIMNFRTNIKL